MEAPLLKNDIIMNEDIEQLNHRFTHHPPKDGQPELYVAIRAKGLELAKLIHTSSPTSREKSLAITKIEEAVMWANAAIARNG